MKRIFSICMILVLVFSLVSCDLIVQDTPVVTVNEDGYVVVNGTVTDIRAEGKYDVTVNEEGYVVVNGSVTNVFAASDALVTLDENGYVVVNGQRTNYKAVLEEEFKPLDAGGILIVESIANESDSLVGMLGGVCETTVVCTADGAGIPTNVDELSAYGCVILCNVANDDMPEGFDRILYDYVNEFGGSLFTVCGNELDSTADDWTVNAYTRDDMYGTLYQELLPVDIIDYTPPTGVVYIVDTSGSMMANGNYENSKLYWALQGIKASLDALTERDYVGILPISDSYTAGVELISRVQRDDIENAIEAIEQQAIEGTLSSRGSILSASIENAVSTLRSCSDLENKHIVIITDASFSAADKELCSYWMSEGAKNNVTMSVVGIDVAQSSIRDMQELLIGSGYSEECLSVVDSSGYGSIGTIIRQELESPAIKNTFYETFTVIGNADTDITDGIAPDDMPTLDGYYGSKLKQGATAALVGNYNVPIYAVWNLGRGKVGSFMCDLNGFWSENFISSSQGATIIVNIISSLMKK